MDVARVRNVGDGQYLFNGQPAPFHRLPVAGEFIMCPPPVGRASVVRVVHGWGTNGAPLADLHVAQATGRGTEGVEI